MSDYEKQIKALENGGGAASGGQAGECPGAAGVVPPRVGGETGGAGGRAVGGAGGGQEGAMTTVAPMQQHGQTAMGRRYGFLCSYCSSRLEAVESMAGQSGTCPTCGNSIVIPILDSRGRLIDPTSGQVIKQDPHPVHAYAAAGHKAPQIAATATGERYIKCPRCARHNALSSNNCLGCGLPFTMEGTAGDSISGTNSWAVASLVLGIVTMAGGCVFGIPSILAIVFGLMALRTTHQATGQSSGQGLAIAGMILGAVGLIIGGLIWSGVIRGII